MRAAILIALQFCSGAALAEILRIEVSGEIVTADLGPASVGDRLTVIANVDLTATCSPWNFDSLFPQTSGTYCTYSPVVGRVEAGPLVLPLGESDWDTVEVIVVDDWNAEFPMPVNGGLPFDGFNIFASGGPLITSLCCEVILEARLEGLDASVFSEASLANWFSADLEDFDFSEIELVTSRPEGDLGYVAEIDSLSIAVVPIPPAILLFFSSLVVVISRKAP